jgi:hypothetical protein
MKANDRVMTGLHPAAAKSYITQDEDNRFIYNKPLNKRCCGPWRSPILALVAASWIWGCAPVTTEGSGADVTPREEDGVLYSADTAVMPFDDEVLQAAANDLEGTDLEGTEERQLPDIDPDDVEAAALQILDVAVHGHPLIGLAASLYVTTTVPTRLTVTSVREADGFEAAVPTPSNLRTDHEVTVLGLRAGQSHQLRIVATDGQGAAVAADPIDYTTGPLPATLPTLVVQTSDAPRMQPGFTMVSLHHTHAPVMMIFALDSDGQVVWYLNQTILYFAPLSDNRAYFMVGGGSKPSLCLTALDGQQGTCIRPDDVGLVSFHHDFDVTPEGTILALSNDVSVIDGYPSPEGTTSYQVVSDLVAEISEDGALLHTTNLIDLLDPYEIGPYFHGPFWGMQAPGPAPKDWSHANSVAADPKDGSYIVSLLGLSKVVKVSRETGALVWRLGRDGDFALSPGGRWFTQSHSARPGPGNTVLLYDNVPDSPPLDSRIVEYTLSMPTTDRATWTATQTFEYTAKSGGNAMILGTVQALENGNILFCDGAVATNSNGDPMDPANHSWARIIELARTPEAEEVFHVEMFHPTGGTGGIQVTHVDHFDSLYPAQP